MKYLLVAEKNSLMRQIQDVYEKHRDKVTETIGGTIDFTALSGHIVKWYEPKDYPQWQDMKWKDMELPLIPEPFKIKPAEGDYQKEKLNTLKEAVRSGKYDGYINACDPDPEGELIFYRAAKYLKITDVPTLRFFQNSLTEKEILNALLHMEDFYRYGRDIHMLEQALSRSRFDWEVGMNCTIAMSVAAGGTSHIGRVKAPTIKLIYDNSEKIDTFKKTVTYQVEADYAEGFSGIMLGDAGKEAEFDHQEDALRVIDELSDTIEATILSITKKTEQKAPEQLYRLSSLQADAGKKGLSPSEVMEICQGLYEKKLLSYPRTNCKFISSEKAKQLPELLKGIAAVPELTEIVGGVTKEDIEAVKGNKNVVSDEKVKEESHDALIPTGIAPDYSVLTDNEKAVYTLVAKRLLAQFLPKLKEEKKVLIADIAGKQFKSTGSEVICRGWTILYDRQQTSQTIPSELGEDDEIFIDEYKVHTKETKPPERLTESSLVSAMENIGKMIEDETLKGKLRAGIGTQATRAQIIEEIVKDGYAKSEGKNHKLFITDKGRGYIKRLLWSDIISPENAARWETVFTDVRDQNVSYGDSLLMCESYVRDFIREVSNREFEREIAGAVLEGVKCPYCGSAVKTLKYSYVCANSEGCSFKISRCDGKLKESDLKKLIKDGITRKIPKVCYSKAKDKYYDAALRLEPKGSEHVVSLVFGDPGIPQQEELNGIKCPYCGKSVKAAKYSFYCEGYLNKECSFNVSRAEGKVTIDHLKALIEKGSTDYIEKICYSKEKDKFYKAKLVLNPKGSERTTNYKFPERKWRQYVDL